MAVKHLFDQFCHLFLICMFVIFVLPAASARVRRVMRPMATAIAANTRGGDVQPGLCGESGAMGVAAGASSRVGARMSDRIGRRRALRRPLWSSFR